MAIPKRIPQRSLSSRRRNVKSTQEAIATFGVMVTKGNTGTTRTPAVTAYREKRSRCIATLFMLGKVTPCSLITAVTLSMKAVTFINNHVYSLMGEPLCELSSPPSACTCAYTAAWCTKGIPQYQQSPDPLTVGALSFFYGCLTKRFTGHPLFSNKHNPP